MRVALPITPERVMGCRVGVDRPADRLTEKLCGPGARGEVVLSTLLRTSPQRLVVAAWERALIASSLMLA